MVASRGGRLRAPTRREVCRSHARGRLPTGGHRPARGALRSEARRPAAREGGRRPGLASLLAGRVALQKPAGGVGSLEGEPLRRRARERPSEESPDSERKGRRTTGRARRFAARARKGPSGDLRVEGSCRWKAPWLVESDERFTPSSKEASSAEPAAKVLARTGATGRRQRCRRYGAEARQRSTEAGDETPESTSKERRREACLHRGSTGGPRPCGGRNRSRTRRGCPSLKTEEVGRRSRPDVPPGHPDALRAGVA